MDEEIFAENKVTHFGQPIGMVVAANKTAAQRAAKAVKITYSPLPSIITIEVNKTKSQLIVFITALEMPFQMASVFAEIYIFFFCDGPWTERVFIKYLCMLLSPPLEGAKKLKFVPLSSS